MSRHEIQPLSDAYDVEVIVGWDPPLSTFYAQVWDRSIAQDDESAELLWIGTRYAEVTDLRRVHAAVSPWAVIPDDVERALYAEAHA